MAPSPASVVLEERPLLLNVGGEHYDDGVLSEALEAEAASQAEQVTGYSHASSRYILLQLCAFTVIADFAQNSVYAPLTAVFEEIICNNYYSSTPHSLLSQHDCKVFPVQQELAVVKGYKDSFSQISSMLLYSSLSRGRLRSRTRYPWPGN